MSLLPRDRVFDGVRYRFLTFYGTDGDSARENAKRFKQNGIDVKRVKIGKRWSLFKKVID